MKKTKEIVAKAKAFWNNLSASKVTYSILIIVLLCIILSIAVTIFCITMAKLIAFLTLHFDFLISLLAGICLFIWWVKSRKPATAPIPQKPPVSVALQHTLARANAMYQTMRQNAMLLICDVCHYTGNAIIKPFSLGSIESPSRIEVTSDGIARHQFIIAKGEGVIDAATLKSIIDRCLKQRLNSHTCPGLPVEPYRSANGEVYDSVMCLGVYDCSEFWRVDLVITNEAVVTHLVNAAYIKLDGNAKNKAPLDEGYF